MATVVFVHGTGVRKPSFLDTFALIQEAFHHYYIPHALEPCLWGDDLGSIAPVKSVPGGVAETAPDPAVVRWDLLYRDPWFELRLLKNRPKPAGPVPPNAPRPGAALWTRVASYQPSSRFKAQLESVRLGGYWTEAYTLAVSDGVVQEALTAARSDIGEPGQAAARAVIACLCLVAQADGRSLPAAGPRNTLVDQLVDDWEARVAGIGSFITGFFGAAATPLIAWKRGDISASSSPAAGDILLYQARGSRIRNHIKKVVEAIDDDVYLLAHSLGGIACVDLLATAVIPNVKGLITAGSQAPLLYEIGALPSVEPPARIGSWFPRWLNLWDRYDFLSYVAAPVFEGLDVTDTAVESGQPFPESHSAYWTNHETWDAVRSFLPA